MHKQVNMEKSRILAWEMADYFRFHENASLSDIARYFNRGYASAAYYLQKAVACRFLKKRAYKDRMYVFKKNRAIENEKETVRLRRQKLPLEEIGKRLGLTRERIRQRLNSAAAHGIIQLNELESLKHPIIHDGENRWHYFLGLVSEIENINRKSYAALVSRHFPSENHSHAGVAERKCLDELVRHADPEDPDCFTRQDANAVRYMLSRLKRSALSLSELRSLVNDYINTEMRQRDIAIKYKLARKKTKNPAIRGNRYLSLAENLGILMHKDRKKKAEENTLYAWQKNGKRQRGYSKTG